MLILSNDDVERLLTMEDCLAAMENAFRDLAEGNGINRPRPRWLAALRQIRSLCEVAAWAAALAWARSLPPSGP